MNSQKRKIILNGICIIFVVSLPLTLGMFRIQNVHGDVDYWQGLAIINHNCDYCRSYSNIGIDVVSKEERYDYKWRISGSGDQNKNSLRRAPVVGTGHQRSAHDRGVTHNWLERYAALQQDGDNSCGSVDFTRYGDMVFKQEKNMMPHSHDDYKKYAAKN